MSSSQSVPLMSDQDYELDRGLPDYEQAINNARRETDIQRPTATTTDQQQQNSQPKFEKAGAAPFWADLRGSRKVNGQIGAMFAKQLGPSDHSDSVAMAQLHIRLAFLRKVLGILAFQFVVTVVLCTAFYVTDDVRLFIQQQPWFLMVSLFGSLGLLFAMFIHAYTVPLNYFLLAAWTILQAITIGAIVSFYDVHVVLQAIVLTAVVVVSLFVYTLQSKHDFKKHYACLFSISLLFLMATMLQMILMSPAFNFAMSLAGAALFSVYLVFDIDMIMHQYNEEDYIVACISIYMDVMGLFLRILEILNEVNRN